MKWLATLILSTLILLGAHPDFAVGDAKKSDAKKQTKQPRPKTKSSVWMNIKLQSTQSILKGLAQGDFANIEKQAKAMSFVGHLEAWMRAKRPDYKRQIQAFSVANDELIRQAKKKNLEGVTLAFHQLTTSCVQCHRLIRDVTK